MQDNFSKFTEKSPLSFNNDLLYPSQQNQNGNQYIFSSFGTNQNTLPEKISQQDTLLKQFTSNSTIPLSEQEYCSNKQYQKGDSDFMSLILKDTTIKSSSLTPNNSTNQNEQLIQKLGMLEIQNKEQEERIQNLQKLNDQLMSAITDLNGNDSNKKYQKEKDILYKQHEKEISDYTSQIKDLKNKLELQKAQMNEKIAELERDKMILEKQLDDEEKNYQKKLQQYKDEKDQMNSILKDYESMRQYAFQLNQTFNNLNNLYSRKNQEAVQITLENKIRVLEEVIEKQKLEAEDRNGQLANDTEKIIQNMKQIHENEKNILMNKITGLQGEKKMIEQQSEYNFKMFTELRNKSENQQDGLYNELDKTRKFINGLEQKIMEKESIIIIQQQKIDGNDTVLRLKEKNYEDQLKTLKNQNEQLEEQMKKQQHELKHLQFLMQEKQFELTDKSKQLKKQIWNEKKKAEQLEEAANRIKVKQDQQKQNENQIVYFFNFLKEDYTKKNSFVIQELLMKEEKIKKLNTQIHKQSTIQNQIAQLNFNSNSNNNTSYSFINNTNLSNLMQNPNQSLLQQNQNGSQNRPSHRQFDRNQHLATSNNANMAIINQDNFNSSDNLNILNTQSHSKSPKLLQNNQVNGSLMSQFQESCSVPISSRCRNNPRSTSNYQSDMSKNNSQNQIVVDKSTNDNFNSYQAINNLLSINSPSNVATLPLLTNEFMSPQSQKLDLSRGELQTMRGLTPTIPTNTCIQDQQQKEILQKNKRSLSQVVPSLGMNVNKSNKNQQQQLLKATNQGKQGSNKSISHSPLAVQQKEITGYNLTLITHEATQKNKQFTNNCDDYQNNSICTPNTNKKGFPQNNQNVHNINNRNRSISPIHSQSVNTCNSHRDNEKIKQSSNQRNIQNDQNKQNNKIQGVTLNTCRDNTQQQNSHFKNLSVSATPLSSVNLNFLINQKDNNTNNQNNQLIHTPDTKNQSSVTTPNTYRSQTNLQQMNQPIYKNGSAQDINFVTKENSMMKSNQSIQMQSQQQRRDITFGTPMMDKVYSEMSQNAQKTIDDQTFSQSTFAINNLGNINDKQVPFQTKIRKILNQFSYIQLNQQNKLNPHVSNQTSNESYQYNTQQQPSFSAYNQQQNLTNQREIENIFFEQMKEAMQTYPEIIDYNNTLLRQSMEKKDMNLALNGLKEIIQKINFNEQEKRELQIDINTLQSKCSLEKASLQNYPTLTQNNLETQNNFHTNSIADSKINQIILENLQTKTYETSSATTFTQEKENIKVLPLSLEINNKFKPLTQTTANGYPTNVNNLSINLNCLKSPQFSSAKVEEKPLPLQQNTDYLNDYNSNLENNSYKNNQQQYSNNKSAQNTNEVKKSKLVDKNNSQSQFNSARVSNKISQEKVLQQTQNNPNRAGNKHFSSISISITNSNNADQSPTMYRVNSGLNHQKNAQSINIHSISNFSNNSVNKTNCQNENNKQNINFSQINNGNSTIISNKNIIQNTFNQDQIKNSSRNTPKTNNVTPSNQRKVNPLKDIIQY